MKDIIMDVKIGQCFKVRNYEDVFIKCINGFVNTNGPTIIDESLVSQNIECTILTNTNFLSDSVSKIKLND